MKYVAVGCMKGQSYKINNSMKVVDGEIEVSEDTHKHFGHVLKADYGLLPAHEVPIEEPKQEQTVVDQPVQPETPVSSGKGRRK